MFVFKESWFKTRIIVYNAYFFSSPQYGIEIWGIASGAKNILNSKERLVNFASQWSSCLFMFKDIYIYIYRSCSKSVFYWTLYYCC